MSGTDLGVVLLCDVPFWYAISMTNSDTRYWPRLSKFRVATACPVLPSAARQSRAKSRAHPLSLRAV
eukprot:1272897-Rhodomonas_salina.1